MGSQQIVYGFIEVSPDWAEEDRMKLDSWSFDKIYPFPNIFSYHELGYESCMISFAGSFKSLEEDWDEWLARFEALLKSLHGRAATMRLEDEHDGLLHVVTDQNETGWAASPLSNTWQKWRKEPGQDYGTPVEMIAR